MPRVKLRNFGKFLGVYLLSLILAVTSILSLTGCKGWPQSIKDNYDVADSTAIAEKIEAVVNPSFTTVESIVQFLQDTNVEFTTDSVFRTMPEQVLINVASVLIKKYGNVTKKSIVEEYRANRTVYDNLPATTTPSSTGTEKEVDLSSTDLGNRRSDDVLSTSYSYRTDTINGKVRKIQIKKEEKYVE